MRLYLIGYFLKIYLNISFFFRIQESARYRNKEVTPTTTEALRDIPADDILQIVVGPNHVAFLFKVFLYNFFILIFKFRTIEWLVYLLILFSIK